MLSLCLTIILSYELIYVIFVILHWDIVGCLYPIRASFSCPMCNFQVLGVKNSVVVVQYSCTYLLIYLHILGLCILLGLSVQVN